MEAKAVTTFPVKLTVFGVHKEVLMSSEFVKEKIVLGRILSADLRIDDPRVSRIHALLEVRGDTLLLTDLASTHGTFVNGQKIVETKVKVGDTLRLGNVNVVLERGSGRTAVLTAPSPGKSNFDSEETQVDIDRSLLNKMDRRDGDERRHTDAFPDERRLEQRRSGDRRLDQRELQRRHGEVSTIEKERRSGDDRREEKDWERRVGERRKGDRRIFDITSLERRIEERRTRKSDDDLLPEELERAFETPAHGRELECTVMWGDHILDVTNYADPIVLTIGESPKNNYVIPSVGIPDEFPLVSIQEDGTAQLSFTEGMKGTIRARDKIYSLEELKKEKFVRRSASSYVLALKQDDFAKLAVGTVNFFILYVKPAPRIRAAPLFDRDALFLRTLIGSALLMALLFIATALIPEPKPVTIEMVPERFARIVIKKRPVLPQAAIVAPEIKPQEGGSVKGEGGKPKQAEGKAGKPNLPDKKETPQVMKPKVVQAEKPKQITKKVIDEKKAKNVGLLKFFGQSGVAKDLKELVDNDAGVDAFGKAVSGMRGRTLEDVGGAGGKGLKGVDVGGGGKTVGIDGPSTKGLGRGDSGDSIGEGVWGPGRLGQKGEASVNIIAENVQVLSGLPKDVINAIVQRHRAEIRQCYEGARQRNPNLRGKVVVAFNIQPNGIVSYSGVKESTVGDSNLENCIISRVRTWVFPKPEAPVITEVTAYPFYLNPAN